MRGPFYYQFMRVSFVSQIHGGPFFKNSLWSLLFIIYQGSLLIEIHDSPFLFTIHDCPFCITNSWVPFIKIHEGPFLFTIH